MKIIDLLKNKKLCFSCEFFPPKTEEGIPQLYDTIRETKKLNPGYISVTYGAGGGTKDKTLEIVRKAKNEIGIETMAHLTCVGHSKSEIRAILIQLKNFGIENIIALRGDPPKGEAEFRPHPDGFKYACELASFIRASFDFCIAVAGYPEGHPECPDQETDWDYLSGKVAAGGDFIVTQLFFNNQDFFHFEKRMKEKGVQAPIVPGIMPITNFHQIVRFTQSCGAHMPEKLLKELEPLQNDPDAVQRYGIQYATRQCEELIARGVPGIHFYTLNKSRAVQTIISNLNQKLKQ